MNGTAPPRVLDRMAAAIYEAVGDVVPVEYESDTSFTEDNAEATRATMAEWSGK